MSDAAYDVALGVLRGFTMGEEVGSQALAVVESQNQALQERAEKAETALRMTIQAFNAQAALSPTQEIDELDCTRCGNERTVGGYGTDERFPCPVCRPTQETDPG